jgi:GH15 family glucan-1,4-alpha-glucosidase
VGAGPIVHRRSASALGLEELAQASVSWLIGAVGNTRPRVDPVYGLTGEVVRSQCRLELPGYRGATPVHLGNQAGSQLQLGGFGDLIETVWRYAGSGHVLGPETGERIADSVDLMCAIWGHADAGLWELADYAHYATSKIGCWTALERLLDLVEQGQAPARHVARWRSERHRICAFIENELWSERRGSYVMKAGSEMLDCGVLLAARRGYGDPKGPPPERHHRRHTRRASRRRPALLFRYSGMQEVENAFLACSFWMVEALAMAGRADEAAEIMDGIVSLASDVGLYSEEMEPGTHALRGNFPQALTHLALISAAAILAEQR